MKSSKIEVKMLPTGLIQYQYSFDITLDDGSLRTITGRSRSYEHAQKKGIIRRFDLIEHGYNEVNSYAL